MKELAAPGTSELEAQGLVIMGEARESSLVERAPDLRPARELSETKWA